MLQNYSDPITYSRFLFFLSNLKPRSVFFFFFFFGLEQTQIINYNKIPTK